MRVTEYAAHRDCGLQAVQFAIARGRIRLTDDNLIDSEVADAAWEDNSDLAMARPGPKPHTTGGGSQNEPARRAAQQRSTEPVPGISFADARALREVYEVQRKQFDLEQKRGLYVRKDEVEQEAFRLYRMLRDALFNLPPRLAAQLAAETEAVTVEDILEAELRRICTDFAEGRIE
jgi:hypothetical protein